MSSESHITKEEYDYLAYMLLVKIIAFISIGQKIGYNKNINEFDIVHIAQTLNYFFNKEDLFDKSNIVKLGMKIIDDNFVHILKQMKEHIINPEIIFSEIKFDQMENERKNDKLNLNFKNRGDMISDYPNGNYHLFFQELRHYMGEYNNDPTHVCAGETLYHSFARFYALGIDEYFDYFKAMSDNNLINYQNQSQEHGFCNNVPCYYWFLDSKKDLKYFNELIKTKDIKLNHIEGNEHGPSALSHIIDMLKYNSYWDRRKRKTIELDDEFRNASFETLFNIVTSNYSIAYDSEELLNLFRVFSEEYYIRKSMEYIISDTGIEKQKNNNKYPIVIGGRIDNLYDESRLNMELNSMVDSIKKFTKK